ncbi:MAG: prolyl oligopeptidase family serine peptidase [Corynebacteriales bacterium]|nr:prolyl oligopeptidase family serine peptidase [Mycobacteriales bacterium]
MGKFTTGKVVELYSAIHAPNRTIYCFKPEGSNAFQLFAWNRKTKQHRQLTNQATGVSYARISPDGERVVWFDTSANGGLDETGSWVTQPFDSEPGTHQLVASDLKPAHSYGISVGNTLVAFSADVVGELRPNETRFNFYIARDGKSQKIVGSDEFVSQMPALSADETLVALHAGTFPNVYTDIRRVSDGELLHSFGRDGRFTSPIAFSPRPGDSRLLLRDEQQGGRYSLVLADATEPESAIKMSTEGVIGDLANRYQWWWYAVAAWTPDANHIVGGFDDGFNTQLHQWQAAAPIKTPQRILTTEGSIHAITPRPNGDVEYRWASISDDYQYRTTGAVPLPLPTPKPIQLNPVHIKQELLGGVPTIVIKPTASPPKNGYSVLLGLHGGPTDHNMNKPLDPRYRQALNHGALLLLPNYEGSTGYGESWRTAMLGRPGMEQADQCVSALEALKKREFVNPKRTMATGHSYGGYLTLQIAGRHPQACPAGYLATAPLADPQSNYESTSGDPIFKPTHVMHFDGTPAQKPETWRSGSPMTWLPFVECPVHLAYFTEDTRYVPEQVENYLNLAEHLGKPVQGKKFAGGHNEKYQTNEQVQLFDDYVRAVLFAGLDLTVNTSKTPPRTMGAMHTSPYPPGSPKNTPRR